LIEAASSADISLFPSGPATARKSKGNFDAEKAAGCMTKVDHLAQTATADREQAAHRSEPLPQADARIRTGDPFITSERSEVEIAAIALDRAKLGQVGST
jgi:hypothetical protein